MKQVFSGLKTIKVDRPFELYHIEAAKPVTAEVQKREDGFYLTFTRLNPEPEEKDTETEILLSVEKGLDKEDLGNINEILESEKLNFIKWG